MHTPGPWRVEQSTRTDQHIIAGNRWIATASNHDFHPTAEGNECTRANARLIAAAPAMLQALLDALPYVEDVLSDPAALACFKPGTVQRHAQAIRDAISAATED